MHTRPKAWILAVALTVGFTVGGGTAPAADSPPPSAADFARLEAEIARLQQQLRDQQQLILQLMQAHEMLLHFVQSTTAGGAAAMPPALSSPLPGATRAPAAGAAREPAGEAPAIEAGSSGSISGRVRATSGQLGEAYVYVDGIKSASGRPPTIEIKQRAKQFVPAVAVVPVGTKVLFPNEDKIFHNVFSTTPGDAFDLGTVKAGDRPNPVVLLKPGHIEVFCNIHSKMRADILVVPNGHWTRVRPDGTFQLSGVPLGSRRIVLWGPGIKPTSQKVEVTPAGASTNLTAEVSASRPHLNKQGGAYGSYDD